MSKAAIASSSARSLLELGDVDGAADRAYYAMFNAARSVLLAMGSVVAPDVGRTHGGLISAFGRHMVKNGPVSKDAGRLLNRAHEIRLVADYNGGSVSLDDARWVVEQAETFVETLRALRQVTQSVVPQTQEFVEQSVLQSEADIRTQVEEKGFNVEGVSGTSDHLYIGPIVAVSALHVAQDIGQHRVVIHNIHSLDKTPALGDRQEVTFKDGRGVVSPQNSPKKGLHR